jgi:hypothetical protein
MEIVRQELELFLTELEIREPEIAQNPKFVITGLSSEFMIKKVLEKMGFEDISYYESITKIPDNISSSAFAVAGALYYQMRDVSNDQ